MDEFLLQLQDLIAKNKIPQVIKILLETFQKCESRNEAAKDEIRGLRNQVILLSSRFNETQDKINSGTMDPMLADTAKNQQIAGFLNLISKLPENKEFTDYINHREEEEAWEKALEANTIDAYNTFFSQYPDGKYKDETKRVIADLERIQQEKENEIKQKAEAEKARRSQEQQASAELQRIRKEKEELLAKKQKAREELEEIERQRKAALDDEKKQEAIAKNQKPQSSEEIQKAQEELDRIKKEKLALLEKKRQTEADLKIVEEQRKAAANREKQASSKTKKGKPVAQAVSSASSVSTTTTDTKNKSFFQTLFSKQYIAWPLISLIIAPVAGLWFKPWWSYENPMQNLYASIFILVVAYAIAAFVFPLPKKRYGILSIFITLYFAMVAHKYFGNQEELYNHYYNRSVLNIISTNIGYIGIALVLLSIIVTAILYFKNKNTSTDTAATVDKTSIASTTNETNEEDSFFARLFNDKYKPWTLTTIFLGLISGGVLTYASDNRHDGFVFGVLFLFLIVFSVIAFKKPFKPQYHSLFFLAVAALIAAMVVLALARRGDNEWFVFLGFLFVPSAIIISLILYFRNKAIDKRKTEV